MRKRRLRGIRRLPAGLPAVLALLLALLLGAAAGAEEGGLRAHPVLDAAFTLLEPGNPFPERYSRETGSSVEARMPLGVPYLWGGREASHLFAKEPDYIVQPAWSDSPAYYRAGLKYIYGFDCYGFTDWVWKTVYGVSLPKISDLLDRRDLRVPGTEGAGTPDLGGLHRILEEGDLLVLQHPGRHIAIYIGTPRMYGYTAEEVPELAEYLDYPLVIHCTVNAQISDRFAELIAHGLEKYRAAQVTDGGVCVSLLVPDSGAAPHRVHQQNQDTLYLELPDGTWLTILGWDTVVRYAWCRIP